VGGVVKNSIGLVSGFFVRAHPLWRGEKGGGFFREPVCFLSPSPRKKKGEETFGKKVKDSLEMARYFSASPQDLVAALAPCGGQHIHIFAIFIKLIKIFEVLKIIRIHEI